MWHKFRILFDKSNHHKEKETRIKGDKKKMMLFVELCDDVIYLSELYCEGN